MGSIPTTPTMKKKWFVYMLRCADGSIYTGATNDMEIRLKKHRAGQGAKYTRGRLPVEPIFVHVAKDMVHAFRVEDRIKRLSREDKLKLATHKEGDELLAHCFRD